MQGMLKYVRSLNFVHLKHLKRKERAVMVKERTRVPVEGNAASEPLTISIGAAMGMAACEGGAEAPQAMREEGGTVASFSRAVLQRARAGGGKWTVRVLLLSLIHISEPTRP